MSLWLGQSGRESLEHCSSLLVLLALGFAVVRYLEWSSDTNLAEFINAIRPPASDPNHSVGSLPHVTSALVSRPDGRTP